MDIKKTKICCLNLDKEICDHFSKDFDVYNGRLGKMVDVTDHNRRLSCTNLLLNYDFPDNVHEYEVFISDLYNKDIIKYNSEEHTRKEIIGESAYYFISNSPETLFNPIPFGCWLLRHNIKNSIRPIINIIFQAAKQTIKYTIKDTARYNSEECIEKTNYMLTDDFAKEKIYGEEIRICDHNFAKTLFNRFENEIKYYQTFHHPQNRDVETGELVPIANFIPLLRNNHGEIVSYIWQSEKEITFMLPQLESKIQLLDILFKEILYCYFSEFFPSIEASSWKNKSHYYLPGMQSLQKEKETITRKYEEDIKVINQKIEKNVKEYKFLHDILSESGSTLVKAIIRYLKWLGFEKVLDKDETVKNDIFEEDIQADLGEKGLLIIEVKGLHGTSKDSECAQISKIRYRRCEERGKFDVYGLYIVNNERSVEPLKRTIPPFTDNQIKDAKNDKRGLVYTWQLFNLFFNIENGFLTKEEARERLLMTGLVDFTPKLVELGKPYAFYQKRTVVCVELYNVKLSINDVLAYEENGQYKTIIIEEMEQEKSSVSEVSNGKIGVKVNTPVPNIKMLYLVTG
ncbi:MAG: hypothetical protein Q4E32_05310 [Bacteroidales bacterium]|nr:hypothetical protein [Bacteroidales bacterium]